MVLTVSPSSDLFVCFFVLYSEKCIHKKIHCDFLFPCKCLTIPKKILSRVKNVWRCSHCVCLFSKYLFWAICVLTPRRSINSWNIKNERRHHKPEADFQIAYFIHPTIRKPSSISSRQERIIKRKISRFEMSMKLQSLKCSLQVSHPPYLPSVIVLRFAYQRSLPPGVLPVVLLFLPSQRLR